MRRRKVWRANLFVTCINTGSFFLSFLVDENLFYKGVDKNKVDPARLTQKHDTIHSDSEEMLEPPYPFHSGNSLLALTRKHNVSV